ncbi:hypothetical protein, partial [Vibrio parahaemolyticus]|uniref:hypothetical protein n=1 Tax=Vibrio parahaemolyticus TaxID=670 RepID=UPI001C5ED964
MLGFVFLLSGKNAVACEKGRYLRYRKRYTFWRFSMLIGAENTFFDVVEQYQKAYDKALEIL